MRRIWTLLRELNLKKFVLLCGTSLGGIVSMLLAPQWKDRLAGVILNDVGPEIGKAGAERIRGYVGQGRSFETWMHAARAMAEAQGDVYPGYRTGRMAALCQAHLQTGLEAGASYSIMT
jgi:pimeloyl-ACP methyl ester carboxylesterase